VCSYHPTPVQDTGGPQISDIQLSYNPHFCTL